MGWDFCEVKTVKKTKKDHHCEYCGRIIPKGSTNIVNWTGKYDGDFINAYTCHWCNKNSDKLTDGEEILDFWDCLHDDFFYDKFQELKKQGYEDVFLKFDEENPNWLIFINEGINGDKEVYREYLPIIKEDN